MKKRYCFFVLFALVLAVLPAFSGDEDEVKISVFPSTAIINASYRGDIKTLREILAAGGVDRDVRDPMGATALHEAILQPDVMVVKLLLDYGFDPNAKAKNGYTPLHWAVAANNINAARLLLQSGADKRIKCSNGRTPLDLARESEKSAFINLLR